LTETPFESTEALGGQALDWADPSALPIEEVRDVFLTLSKALRAYQLYDPNNPVYKRFAANLREALQRVWEVRDRLQILVEEDRLTWLGEEVYRNESRGESIAFLFYRDGIRDFTLRKGVEESEFEHFIDALHRARSARAEGEDLVTVLWELDLKLVSYSAIDPGADGVDISGFSAPPQVLNAGGILASELGRLPAEPQERAPFVGGGGVATDFAEGEGDEEEDGEEGEGEESAESGGSAAPAGTVRKEDFNPTLYALDEDERRYLAQEIQRERERDLRRDVLYALFDRLEESGNPLRQGEILGILRTLLPSFLSRGAVLSAAEVVEVVQGLRGRGTFSGEPEVLAERLLDDLSTPEVVDELVRAVQDGSVAPNARELAELLRHLRPAALSSLLRGVEGTQEEALRTVLRQAIESIGTVHRDVVIRLLSSADTSVAVGAIRLAGKLQITEASGSLARLLEQGAPEVKRAVLEAAAEIPSSILAGAMQRLLRDPSREFRLGAARVLGRQRYAPATQELRTILDGKEIREADVTEKVAFFEAYGLVAGEQAVDYLDKLLNSKGFLGRREPAELRAGAAVGLGKVAGPRARAALEKARSDEDPVVRAAVGRALRGEEVSDG